MIVSRLAAAGFVFILLIGGVQQAAASGDSDDPIQNAGDILQAALPLAGLVGTFYGGGTDWDGTLDDGKWDRQGTQQIVYSWGTSFLIQRGWKIAAAKMRPNGSARSSYPSGHTNSAFSGAAFIATRYGWKWGVPSYAAAAFTGYSRVYSDWHFADDVVAGASIAILTNFYFVTPHPGRVAVLPILDQDGVKVSVTIKEGSDAKLVVSENPKWRFDYAFGPSFLRKNEVAAPADGGTAFDLETFDKIDDPTTTAAAAMNYFPSRRHEIQLFYNPFESRDNGGFSEDVTFGGKTFEAGAPLQSAWRLHDLRARYRYRALDHEKFHVLAGAGLMMQSLYVAIETRDEAKDRASVEDVAVLPFLDLEAVWTPHRRFSLAIGGSGVSISTDWMADVAVLGNYHFNSAWTATAGYQFYGRDIETDELVNHVEFNVPYGAVTYSW